MVIKHFFGYNKAHPKNHDRSGFGVVNITK